MMSLIAVNSPKTKKTLSKVHLTVPMVFKIQGILSKLLSTPLLMIMIVSLYILLIKTKIKKRKGKGKGKKIVAIIKK